MVINAGDCSANDAANPLLTDSYYQNNTHFGMFTLMVRPIPRLTTRVGYSATTTPRYFHANDVTLSLKYAF
ncbi:MAG: hypothetical protein HY233_01820 [Acidobacteriales bacterium]|nr:hypothetical protein [Terriglobales bacterium]